MASTGDLCGRRRRTTAATGTPRGAVARAEPAGQREPAEADRDGDGEARRQAGRRFAGRPDAGGHDRPGDARSRAPSRASRSATARCGRALALGRRLAQDDERQRRVGEAHPEPGHAEGRRRRPATGRPGRSTSSNPASPTMVDREARPGRSVGSASAAHRGPGSRRRPSRRSSPRSGRSRPASPTGRASPTRVSATNASTPKKAKVRMPRSRTAAGRTGRARERPGRASGAGAPGSRRRRPTAVSATVGSGSPAGQPDRQQAGPEGDESAPAAGGADRRRGAVARRSPAGAGDRARARRASAHPATAMSGSRPRKTNRQPMTRRRRRRSPGR